MTKNKGPLASEAAKYAEHLADQSGQALTALISAHGNVGDLIKMDFSECEVLIHDHLRQKVGGLALGCFLLATRLSPGATATPLDEDSNLLLLRVTGQARLPNASETDLNRFLAGQRVATLDAMWDAQGKIDQFTLNQLRYAGIRCRLLGTFRMKETKPSEWKLSFGADVSNFYSGRGLKVYKPFGAALAQIVNFQKTKGDDSHPLSGKRVAIGRVRYASSERMVDPAGDSVQVELDPTDLIARRTALFGMSRTGKSNTTKVIASSVFRLREQNKTKGLIGQLVFDVNGEYANENTQDGSEENAACLKNIALHTANATNSDVATYGLASHPNDPTRTIVKVNFFGGLVSKTSTADELSEALEPLLVGKMLIDGQIASDSSKYIANFRNTSLDIPAVLDPSSSVRFQRIILAYRAALSAAGFAPPDTVKKALLKGLFSKDLVQALEQSKSSDSGMYVRAATIIKKETVSWDEAVELVKGLRRFIQDTKHSGYDDFNSKYASQHDGRSWHDERLTGILSIFEYANGVNALRALKDEHDPGSVGDYAQSVMDDLVAGKLVIFDQSLGDPEMNRAAAERIMWVIFNRQKQEFVTAKKDKEGNLIPPPDILVYAEEAHNLLPPNAATDVSNIWSRVAKEGSKYRIGLVYATQEPSSIQSNIMKNTDNWFVAHLNNADETKELRKYYDFDDFVPSILQVPDPGFLRMRTLSNPYIVPVQINRFLVKAK
ncbi:helicase HerA domain-containing protein [Bradyrhizobium japonicum]|uniref:helicase HerA domain-containing protein n=1 Tax=Bradyrhizobium japonicum TaxID=375 RepID=UPI001BACCA5B|nr:DUF87 domain-containing protein [Bradyrhizobium japonicum]MBR0960841.1 DUF87 domain-containing protein [Bradyrhizobium japonicum]